MPDFTIDHDLIYPRDDDHRFRIYARQGDKLDVLAVARDASSVGSAIFQLHDDQKENGETLGDLGALGVYDAVDREWIVLPWHRRGVAYPDRQA